MRASMFVLTGVLACASVQGHAQDEKHGRKYKPLPPTAVVVVNVQKNSNGKPLPNAAVVFHTVREGKAGTMEVKTDPEGRASIDILEVGSHVKLQVFAPGFASYASEFDVTSPDQKEMLVKLIRPQEQVSLYEDNDGKAAVVKPGIQEHVVTKPAPTTPSPTTPTPPQTPPEVQR